MTNIAVDYMNTLKKKQEQFGTPHFITRLDKHETCKTTGIKIYRYELFIISNITNNYISIQLTEEEMEENYTFIEYEKFLDKLRREINSIKAEYMIESNYANYQQNSFIIPFFEFKNVIDMVDYYKNLEKEFENFQKDYVDNFDFNEKIIHNQRIKHERINADLKKIADIIHNKKPYFKEIKKIEITKEGYLLLSDTQCFEPTNLKYPSDIIIPFDINKFEKENYSLKEITHEVLEAIKNFENPNIQVQYYITNRLYNQLKEITDFCFKEDQIFKTLNSTLKDIEENVDKNPIQGIQNFHDQINMITQINYLGHKVLEFLTFDFLYSDNNLELVDFYQELTDITKLDILIAINNELEYTLAENDYKEEERDIILSFQERIETMIKAEENKTLNKQKTESNKYTSHTSLKQVTLTLKELLEHASKFSEESQKNVKLTIILEKED